MCTDEESCQAQVKSSGAEKSEDDRRASRADLSGQQSYGVLHGG